MIFTAIPAPHMKFQTKPSRDRFLSFDSSADPADRIIALTSGQAKQLLIGSMYTFHIQRSGPTSLYIVLLSSKSEATYRRLMVVMSNLTNERFPTDILLTLNVVQ